jgi:hypothetical protein
MLIQTYRNALANLGSWMMNTGKAGDTEKYSESRLGSNVKDEGEDLAITGRVSLVTANSEMVVLKLKMRSGKTHWIGISAREGNPVVMRKFTDATGKATLLRGSEIPLEFRRSRIEYAAQTWLQNSISKIA